MHNWLIAGVFLVSVAASGKSEDREVAPYTAVHVASGIRATATLGPQRPVHVEADPETLPFVETVVEDGALQVRFKPGMHLRDTGEVRVTLQTPELRGAGASGGSRIQAQLSRGDVSLEASGGSEIHATGLDAGKLSAHGSGGSTLEVSGRADAVSLHLSGGSELHGRGLAARDVDVHASGGSEAELQASGNIGGSLSGGSQLEAKGGARTAVTTSGGSEVHTD